MSYFRVRNWEKFQHYKDRNPPWIKLHTELLDNYEFAMLDDASKLLAMCSWLLAARSGNKIPVDLAWIQRRCNLRAKPDFRLLIESGFIEEIQEVPNVEQDASKALADCKQDASPRALARGETETEERESKTPPTKGRRAKTPETPLPADFCLTDDLRAYVADKIPDADPGNLFLKFTLQATAKAWTYADWAAAFKTYVRNAAPNSGHWAAGQYPKRGGDIRWQ